MARGEDAYPISPHIPPVSGPASSSLSAACFLANLLPEGRALDAVSSMKRISKANIFALI
ncbi:MULTISPECIES: HipA N-terminal domain-containing protein [unclassified Caballeronia]|uniref:HipA N-terminal domain-containing protein n=1 Tax=unclassified Caballeronia TaxID=2646786 RepID=UPI0032ECA59A